MALALWWSSSEPVSKREPCALPARAADSEDVGRRGGRHGDEDDDDCSDDDLSVLEVEDAKGETRSESDQVVHFGDAPGEERVEILDM